MELQLVALMHQNPYGMATKLNLRILALLLGIVVAVMCTAVIVKLSLPVAF